MDEKTKELLMKLFRKYQTVGVVSGNSYLTNQDYNLLIHDKSFPVNCQSTQQTAENIIKNEIKLLNTTYKKETSVKKRANILSELNALNRTLKLLTKIEEK